MKQTFKETRLAEFRKKFGFTVSYEVEQFLSETIDMAERRIINKAIKELKSIETGLGTYDYFIDRVYKKLKSLSPKE